MKIASQKGHLVELLNAGRLPAPQEFRERFIDRERPRQPKSPEELRRPLNQVMIRNTRANAKIALPPRRAETVLFEPGPDEAAFCENWESELRGFGRASAGPSQSSRTHFSSWAAARRLGARRSRHFLTPPSRSAGARPLETGGFSRRS
jgi:hypothetical protein